jgi:hypothetical protein
MGVKTLDFPKGKGSSYHVVIYVPSTRNVSEKISNAQFQSRIRDTVSFLRKTLGGSTRLAGVGNYYSDKLRRSVSETVAKVESFTTRASYYRYDQEIEAFLNRKKKEWSQESLSYEYNGS